MGFLRRNPVYLTAMVFLPLLVTVFFTSLLDEGQPQEMPVGIVDNDNTSTTRSLIRLLNDFQTTGIVANYPSVTDARRAVQHGEIYAFMYIPEGTTEKLLSQRQPKISFYYSNTTLVAGALLFRDLKTISVLGSAAVGKAVASTLGLTEEQAMTFLQPIALDMHLLGNPWVNYNMYLSTMLIPGSILLFVMLLTAYTLGMELKYGTCKELLTMSGGNPFKAVYAKLLPQTLTFIVMLTASLVYMFYGLEFAHARGFLLMLLLATLAIMAAQGFAIMVFALIPNVRTSMSVCSLWGVLSFSMMGTAFPVQAMDTPLQALSYLFPLRHYFLIYAENIFNGYPLSATNVNIVALLLFILIPMLFVPRIAKIYREFEYEP